MTNDIINYSALIDQAMHIIVKKSLEILMKAPNKNIGEHHFFISFLTKFPGVSISEKLSHKYPEEMTIVLQYQFEDLYVDDNGFRVILSFDNIKEQIIVPFAAITAFADPSVKFGLQFKFTESQVNDANKFHSTHQENDSVDSQDIQDVIHASGATNVITLDSFRNKRK